MPAFKRRLNAGIRRRTDEGNLVSPTRCRIAILGFGTVGSAVARRLTGPHVPLGLELTHIFDRRAHEKSEALSASRITWTTSIDEVLASDADVVVETVGGVEPAADWIRAALAAGKSVVTANKQVVARRGAALLTLAERQGRQLRVEAAVGGAKPVRCAVGEGLAGDRIMRSLANLLRAPKVVLSRMGGIGGSVDDAVGDSLARG